MKKQTVAMVWAVVILLMVVCSVGIYLKNSMKNTKKDVEEKVVFECMSADITSYKVKSQDVNYSLEKNGDEWCIRIGDSLITKLDEKKTDDLLRYVSLILAKGTISESELDRYDKKGAAEAVITLKNGDEHTIVFLGEANGECAFRISGDNSAYKMDVSVKAVFLSEPDSLRKTEVFENLSGLEKKLESFQYVYPSGGKRIGIRVKKGSELTTGENKFILTEPYVWEADDEKVTQQIIVNIPSLKKIKFLDGVKNIAEYGLGEDERAEMSFATAKGEQTLYLGKNDGGIVYAMLKGEDEIFAINSSQIDFLNVESFYLIETQLFDIDEENFEEIAITTSENESFNVKKINTSGGVAYSMNGADMNESAFDELIGEIEELEITGMVKATPDDKSDITIAARYNNADFGAELTVYGDKSYAVSYDGTPRFTVDRKKVDDILNKFREIAKNPIRAKKEKKGKD